MVRLRRSLKYAAMPFGLVVCMLVLPTTVRAAGLTLTAAGIGDGFTLTVFASGFAQDGLGPLGIAVAPTGNVIVDNFGNATNYVFANLDGQTPGSALSSTSFSGFPPAFATTNGAMWGSGGFSGPNAGQLIKFNSNGTINTAYSIAGLSVTNGMWTNPANGHLIATGANGLVDIDVSGLTPTFRSINVTGVDGVTVSPDGATVYGAVGGGIEGWSIATGAIVFPFLSSGPADGMGIITSANPALNGDIVVNQNDGTLELVDPISRAVVEIANGGTRGDYTSPDALGGLFLTQTSSVDRLSCGAGCSIGGPGPNTAVPEPVSMVLLGSGLASVVIRRRRQAARIL
jgi:hypothetical protein